MKIVYLYCTSKMFKQTGEGLPMKFAAMPTPWTAIATPTCRGEGWIGKTTGPSRMKDRATIVVPRIIHSLNRTVYYTTGPSRMKDRATIMEPRTLHNLNRTVH
jgi:hypothetical protein